MSNNSSTGHSLVLKFCPDCHNQELCQEAGSANKSSKSYIETWNLSNADLAVSAASSRSYLFFVAALASTFLTTALEFTFCETDNIFSIKSAKKDGVVNIHKVDPWDRLPQHISWINLANATTSSVPAGNVSMISPNSEFCHRHHLSYQSSCHGITRKMPRLDLFPSPSTILPCR